MVPPHGGRREGAGRKPQGKARKVKTSAAIDPDLLATLDAEAARRGITRNAMLDEVLRLWVTSLDRDDA